MKEYAADLWRRALRAMATAKADLRDGDGDAAASRAYYAAFYAVSALLAVEGKTFSKHSALEAALHRDLVRSGRFPVELGAAYRSLRVLRNTGDYGGLEHVSRQQAQEGIDTARRIVQAIADMHVGLSL